MLAAESLLCGMVAYFQGHLREHPGIIGQKKFIYDLWGDTVNTASRMESHSTGNAILITEQTYELIKDDFLCEPRGVINVKGKGEMKVWYLPDKKNAVSPSV